MEELLTAAIAPYIAQLHDQAARNVSAAKALCQKMTPEAAAKLAGTKTHPLQQKVENRATG